MDLAPMPGGSPRTDVARDGGAPPRDRWKNRLDWVASLLRTAPSGQEGGGCLLWVDQNGSVRMRILERSLTIGRDPICDLVLPLPGVAQRHCRIARSAAGAQIRDLGSPSGTWLNGHRVDAAERPLRDGDVLELGGVPIAFVA